MNTYIQTTATNNINNNNNNNNKLHSNVEMQKNGNKLGNTRSTSPIAEPKGTRGRDDFNPVMELKEEQVGAMLRDGLLVENAVFGAQDNFDNWGLKDDLLRGIYGYGFEKPSLIQCKAIGPITSGQDVIAQAQSGTGKTGAFSISALQLIDTSGTGIAKLQVIVLTPVRELAEQSNRVINSIGSVMKIKSHCFVGGGESEYDNRTTIRKGIHCAVGTPGRLTSLIEKGFLKLDSLKLLIIDEADEMLKEGGFRENLKYIIQMLPEQCGCALFSATMPLEVFQTANKFLRNPTRILVKKEEIALRGIKQYLVSLQEDTQKIDCIKDLFSRLVFHQVFIFCNSKQRVEWLKNELASDDYTAVMVHGDMEQTDRNEAVQRFRDGTDRILIATDVLARGLDVHHVSLVVNFDIPLDRENYIHRIGRAGRMGRKGVAINLVLQQEDYKMRDIEHVYQTAIEDLPADLDEVNACM